MAIHTKLNDLLEIEHPIMLEDMAVLTNGQLITEDAGLKLDQ